MANKRKAEYKPLLFTTTVRNPQRVKALLWVLQKYNGMIMSDKLAIEIMGELIRYGLYRPTKKTEEIKRKWKDSFAGNFSKTILDDDEVEYLIRNNPQSHKQAGFLYGFPSRFATIYNFAKELGFVYFEQNKPIEFSELGLKLSTVYDVTLVSGKIEVSEKHPEYEQQAFLQAMCKYQRANPFIRVLNDNIPLLLLLKVLKRINADTEWNGRGLTRKELPLLIFWKDNDDETLYKRIVRLRKEYGYNPSDEVIVDICTKEIMEGKMKKFKPQSIMNEYPDEFIRKMRVTGLISLRGAGHFIDINHNEDEKVEYVLRTYSNYKHYESEREFFDYMAKKDNNLFSIESVKVSPKQNEQLLIKQLADFDWEVIKSELFILSHKRNSKNLTLKVIPAPERLEFLTAMAIKSKLPNVRVIPNYRCDDTGLPTSTAGGNAGDIECIEQPHGILVEVTMAEGRQQTIMEVWPIERHLVSFKEKYTKNSQCVFVAPTIFHDTTSQIEWVKSVKGHTIRSYKIDDFVSYLETNSRLYKE